MSSHITKEENYMFSALLAAQRSKDPSTKVGAVIVNKQGRIVATGYNGFPNGIHDSLLPWTKDSLVKHETKYPYVVHAEANSILNATVLDLSECTIYSTLFPCCECVKMIIQKGIRKIVYASLPDMDKSEYQSSMKMINLVGIETIRYEGLKSIRLDLPYDCKK